MNNINPPMEVEPLALLDNAIEMQHARMRGYEIESEALVLETVRSLDYVYFKDLIPELSSQSHPTRQELAIMQWGVNEALYRVLPKVLRKGAPRVLRPNQTVQQQADDFIFDAGMLAMAKRQRLLLAQGLLKGFVDPRRTRDFRVLVLDAVDPSTYWDAIGRAGMAWISSRTMQQDRALESELERRYMEVLPQFGKHLPGSVAKALEGYENHFHEWAQLYLRRMVYRDLLAEDDVIGGHPYGRYIAILTVISAMCQMRICHARLLVESASSMGMREVLTGSVSWSGLRDKVAAFLDADPDEVSSLLGSLALSPENLRYHLNSGTPAWAPIIRTNDDFCILPSYGMDINPFVFLMRQLKEQHREDWFRLANRREERWVQELGGLFPAPRWKCVSGPKLKRMGQLVTDIDFIAYDSQTQQLALFQLKWQQPALADEKMRYSNGANLVNTSNRWVQDVRAWLAEFGVAELRMRARLGSVAVDQVSLFVVARYSAHIPGHVNTDPQASWADWGHLCKCRSGRTNGSVLDLVQDLCTETAKMRVDLKPESFALPLPSLALVINPLRSAVT